MIYWSLGSVPDADVSDYFTFNNNNLKNFTFQTPMPTYVLVLVMFMFFGNFLPGAVRPSLMGNENRNRSAENRHDFERTEIILWVIEIEIGFHRRLQGMNG